MYHQLSTDLAVGDQAAQQLEQGFRVRFDQRRPFDVGGPRRLRGGVVCQATKRRGALLEGVDGRPQRGLDGFALLGEQRVDAIRVSGAALEAKAVTFVELPQGAMALGTGQEGSRVRQLGAELTVRLVGSVN